MPKHEVIPAVKPAKQLVSPDQRQAEIRVYDAGSAFGDQARARVKDVPEGFEVERLRGAGLFEVSWDHVLREDAVITFGIETVTGVKRVRATLSPNLDELAAYDDENPPIKPQQEGETPEEKTDA